jgi:hypothetical protein
MDQSEQIRPGPHEAQVETAIQSPQAPIASSGELGHTGPNEFRLPDELTWGGLILLLASLIPGILTTWYVGVGLSLNALYQANGPTWIGANAGAHARPRDSVLDHFLLPWLVGSTCAMAGMLSLVFPVLPSRWRFFTILAGVCAIPGILFGLHKLSTDFGPGEGPYLMAYGPLLGVVVGIGIACGLLLMRERKHSA